MRRESGRLATGKTMLAFIRFLLPTLLILLGGISASVQAANPQVAAGYYHNVALKNDGTVWTWGYNGFGQLGNGSTTDSSSPEQVQGLAGMTAVAAGFFHSAALKSDGTVWVWGDNGYDQLGVGGGNVAISAAPLQVAGLRDVKAIAASGGHTLALKNDGSVWAWGWNAYGQLGIGSVANATAPVQLPGLHGVGAIAAGFFHSLALNFDGSAWSWGYNGHGQLGNGATADSILPSQVAGAHAAGLGTIKSLAAGGGHSLALKSDGTVWAWGWNGFGQLGNGSLADSSLPLQVSGVNAGSAIAAGFFHSVALNRDGKLQAWGYNAYGQLGDGSTTDASIPTPVIQVASVASIAASNHHSLALKHDGTLWAWGWNDDGELGNAGRVSSLVPVGVSGPDGKGFLSLGSASYQDLWNNPSEPGWGIGITQHGATLFAAWYSYDADGRATWLVMPGGSWTGSSTYAGSLYETAGQNTGIPYTPGTIQATSVGSASIDFIGADRAVLSFTYRGVAGLRELSRYVFDASGSATEVNLSDMWWTPTESGWGLNIIQQFGTIFAGWYTYDAAGRPSWFVLPGGAWIAPDTYRGTLYRTASSPTGLALSQGAVATTAAGIASLRFVDADNAVLSYTVDGVTGTKAISRMKF
jgi:alpha-tubulin suppressor-like RCC1 family protein